MNQTTDLSFQEIVAFIFLVFSMLLIGCTPGQTMEGSPAEKKLPVYKPVENNTINNGDNDEPVSYLDESLGSLTDQIINSMTESGGKKIAVIEFSNLDGDITELGKFISEELITRLFMTKRFDEVIERQLLNKILAEQNLSLTGIIDIESAQKLGQLLGVDAVVSGTLTDLGSVFRINARLISTTTGSVFAVAASELNKDEGIIKLSNSVSQKIKNSSKSDNILNDTGVVLYDDFNREDFGDWQPHSGEWLMVDGAIAQNSYSSSAFITRDNNGWRNYILELKIRCLEKWGPVIGVRYNDKSKQCIALNFSGGNGHWVGIDLFNVETGKIKSLPGARRFKLNMGQWYGLKIEVKGGTIKCFINGDHLLTVSDPEIARLRTGGLAFGTYSSRAYFDDVKVTMIE